MPSRKSPPLLVGSASLLMLAGCVQLMAPKSALEQRPLANPWAQESGLFYPLDIGNHWGYEYTSSFQIIPSGGPAGNPDVIESLVDVDVTGTAERFGRTYLVQRESDGQGYEAEFLYRQDKSGLFNADPEPASMKALAQRDEVLTRLVGDATPSMKEAYRAAMARVIAKQSAVRKALHGAGHGGAAIGQTSGPLAGEIALLRYPIATGKTWHVREDPLVVYTVEAQESLQLPAGTLNGWRIRIDWPGFFGPEDHAAVWYGRDGRLQLRAHVESEATDENGNVIGTVVGDDVQQLSEVSLVKKDPS